jgi:hypothetical protein
LTTVLTRRGIVPALAVVLGVSGVAASVEPVTYRLERFSGGLRELRTTFDRAQLVLLQKLNRVDLDHLAQLGSIVVPDRWVADELTYSSLPVSYGWAAAKPKALVVYQPAQVFGAYESGRLVRCGPVSSGRSEAPTPEGFFALTWKSKGRTALGRGREMALRLGRSVAIGCGRSPRGPGHTGSGSRRL